MIILHPSKGEWHVNIDHLFSYEPNGAGSSVYSRGYAGARLVAEPVGRILELVEAARAKRAAHGASASLEAVHELRSVLSGFSNDLYQNLMAVDNHRQRR